jgi:hypothetical protein
MLYCSIECLVDQSNQYSPSVNIRHVIIEIQLTRTNRQQKHNCTSSRILANIIENGEYDSVAYWEGGEGVVRNGKIK